MSDYPEDIYTEPANVDVNTLRNLGPLAAMAGVWEGQRGMVVMAHGQAAPDAKSFELVATHVDPHFGIRSSPFLDHAFKTVEFRIKVTVNDDGTWGYEEDTVLQIQGQSELFHHTDRNLLRRVAAPTPNPLAR